MNGKRMARGMAFILLLCMLCFQAGAESALSDVMRAGTTLLTETENVTLRGSASFSLNERFFKKLVVTYLRASDKDHLLDVAYRTENYGTPGYDSGFAILGVDGMAQVLDRYDDTIADDIDYPGRNTLLSGYHTQAVLSYATQALQLMEPLFLNRFVTAEQTDAGERVHLAFRGDDLPDALTKLAKDAISDMMMDEFFIDIPDYGDYPDEHMLLYDSLEILASAYMECFPEEDQDEAERFLEWMWAEKEPGEKATDEEWDRFGAAYGRMVAMTGKASDAYSEGYSYLSSDGTMTHYKSYSEYMRDRGICYVSWEDDEAAFDACLLDAIADGALTEEQVSDLSHEELEEMLDIEDWFETKGARQGAVDVRIFNDGSVAYFPTMEESRVAAEESVTWGIVGNMKAYDFASVRVTFQLDELGRFAWAEGEVTVTVRGWNGDTYDVTMRFDISAEDYGTTDLEEMLENWDSETMEARQNVP